MAANMFYAVTPATRFRQWCEEEAGMSASAFCVVLAVYAAARVQESPVSRQQLVELLRRDCGDAPRGLVWAERNGFVQVARRVGNATWFEPTARCFRLMRQIFQEVK